VERLLIVDEDDRQRDSLSQLLRSHGFEVSVATSGPSALAEFGADGADMVLLDLVLPGMPGIDVCRELRRQSEVPIIMVTELDSEIDKVVGLEVGADDYVTKPYSPRELLARVRAVFRRCCAPAAEQSAAILSAGPVRMDLDRHVVTVADQPAPLPLREFALLELLLRNAGRVLTRRQMIERVWGPEYLANSNTLDTHLKRLRARLEHSPAAPRHLITVRGVGYKFQP
jgi:two-component system response regulator RegX3